MIVLAAPGWMRDGLCVHADPDVFFPAKGGSARAAKAVCAGCPVRADCLGYALANGERFGVWGGLSPQERRELRRHGTLRTAAQDALGTVAS